MNLQKRFLIQFNNKTDYRRLHWWLLLLLVTLGSSLLWTVFRYSLLVIPILIAIYIQLQKAFKVRLLLDRNNLQIAKTFMGIPYFQLNQPYSKIIWHEQQQRLIFMANKSTNADLQLALQDQGLQLQKEKTMSCLCDTKTAQNLLDKLLEGTKKLQLTNFYHFR